MSHETQAPAPDDSAVARSGRWKAGTAVGVAGLLAFVVLGLATVVGMFLPDHQAAAFFVGLFPWSLGGLLVGIVGMVVAGFGRPSAVPDDPLDQV